MKTTSRLAMVLALLALGIPQSHAGTEKYRLSWREDPATSIVICWNQVSGEEPAVHMGTTDNGTDAESYAITHRPDLVRDYRGMKNHFARITGLQPDTAYYFVIKDSDSTSERMWFRTMPAGPEPISFITGGDSRSLTPPRRAGFKLVAAIRPHFVFFGGDYMGTGTDAEWNEWLNDWQLTRSADGRMYPIVAAHGNHENQDPQMVHNIFDTPSPDIHYALPIGGDFLRLYTLNSEIEADAAKWTAQRDWFAADLAAHDNVDWKVVQYHRPMRPHTSGKGEGLGRITAWASLIHDHRVDLVVECDSHMVKRTWPIRPDEGPESFEGFTRDDETGTVYIGEGCWGAPVRPNDDDKPWTRASGSFHQFDLVHVYTDRMEIRTVQFVNEDAVVPNTEEDVFAIPAGLTIWEPPTGAVVTIENRLARTAGLGDIK